MPFAGALESDRPVRIFVQLGRGFGAREWEQRWSKGAIPGINERLPYGYYHAADSSFRIDYSEDHAETWPSKVVRLGLRRLLGFDLVHVWRNRRMILGADAVWTHTEFEHLATLALLRSYRFRPKPKMIAQSIWLFDQWRRLSTTKRWLYRTLLKHADVLTVQSPANLMVLRRLLPQNRSELVLYGNDISGLRPATLRNAHNPTRIVALGNDMHRDWNTLIAAVDGWPGCEVRIGSTRLGLRRLAGKQVSIVPVRSAREAKDLYAWGEIAVVPLERNLHASGITVISEAVVSGLPVVCTRTGGLSAYFSDQEVRYVPPEDPEAMSCALKELAANDELRFALAEKAQKRILTADLSSRARAFRLRMLTEELLASRSSNTEQDSHPDGSPHIIERAP